jgi:hypothetical protein
MKLRGSIIRDGNLTVLPDEKIYSQVRLTGFECWFIHTIPAFVTYLESLRLLEFGISRLIKETLELLSSPILEWYGFTQGRLFTPYLSA